MRRYDKSVKGYLKRARKLLNLKTNESLFYAALELRLGLEALLKSHLEPHEHIPKKSKKAYEISKLEKSYQNAFHKISSREYILYAADGKKSIKLKYIPPSSALMSKAKRLGDYLHYKHATLFNKPFFLTFSNFLEDFFLELDKAAKSTTLGPALIKERTATGLKVKLSVSNKKKFNKFLRENAGKSILLKVKDLE